MDPSGRTDLQRVSLAFEGYTLRCLCRSEGLASQRCWTLQTSDADASQDVPGKTVLPISRAPCALPVLKCDLSMLLPLAENVVDDIGLDIWESSRVLCSYLLHNNVVKQLITAAPGILELGAGQTTTSHSHCVTV